MKKYELARVEGLDASLDAVRVAGEVDIDCAQALREELERIVREGGLHVLVDIEQVRHLDSFSLGAFVGVRQFARGRGGSLSFICSNPLLRRLFSMTNLDKLFAFHDSVEDFQAAHLAERRADAAGGPDRALENAARARLERTPKVS